MTQERIVMCPKSGNECHKAWCEVYAKCVHDENTDSAQSELTTLRAQLEEARKENDFAKRVIESERQYEKAHHKLLEENAALKKEVERVKNDRKVLLHSSRDEYAKGFAEWMGENPDWAYVKNDINMWFHIVSDEKKSTSDLLEEYKRNINALNEKQ